MITHKNPKKLPIFTAPFKNSHRRKTPIWVPTMKFYGDSSDCLLVGFDTEYKNEGDHNKLLSYQFYAKHPNGAEWKGIGYLNNDKDRIPLSDFFEWVFSEGYKQHNLTDYPEKIYFIGHFTIADLPGFSNFNTMKTMVNAVQKCLITTARGTKVEMTNAAGEEFSINAILRDSKLLAPSGKQRLDDIGNLIGIKKLKMTEEEITNMDKVLEDDPEKFEEYALRDAEICVRYADTLLKVTNEISGEPYLPSTIGSIGVKHLLQIWKDSAKDKNSILGREVIEEGRWQKQKNQFWMRKKPVNVLSRHLYEEFATECYHGGRNEQYFFGIGEEGVWTDYDLCGAYTTAMALIEMPKWHDLYATTDPKEIINLNTMGYAVVEFEFPEDTRFPCLPMRHNGGLIFPLKGLSSCCSPELVLAQQMGAELTIHHGIVLPTDSSVKPFAEFINSCTAHRKSHQKGSVFELFWKEIGNSTYGKTAQGLRPKRCFDTRTADMRQLPESEISNPYFAAYVTSFIRAALGEILAAIPKSALVSNATTDGFLSDVSDRKIKHLIKGPLCQKFGNARKSITGEFEVLEAKHKIKQPLGWRTRGQLTLLPIKGNKMVLAKAGLKPPTYHKLEQNNWIVDVFFERTPQSKYTIEVLTSLRDIWLNDCELTNYKLEKRISMEYDWKRMPTNPEMRSFEQWNHLYFDTKAWPDIESYVKCREMWKEYSTSVPICLKTVKDLKDFNDYRSFDIKGVGLKKSKKNSIIKTAWRMFVRAYARSEWGLDRSHFSYPQISEWLTKEGYPTKRTDLENGVRKTMVLKEHLIPKTDDVMKFVRVVKRKLPSFREDLLLSKDADPKTK